MVCKVLTANRVSDGDVVFFTSDDGWSLRISDAFRAQDDAALKRLEEQVLLSEAGTEVTDVYLFDAEVIDGVVRPRHIRERIRTLGPTVRVDLGKQSSGTGGAFSAAN